MDSRSWVQPDTGDTAWMLASAALVLLMTPGLAFFYGGMVRAKSVLNMIMMSVSAMGVVTVLWVLYGYSLAFGNDVANLFGDPTQYFGLKGLIGGNAAAEVVADPSRRHRSGRRGQYPAGVHAARHGVRRVPADVRDHHRRADLRRGRRPHQVRRLAAVRRPVGDGRLLPHRALGVRVRRRHRRVRRLDRQQARGDRLRRWYRGSHQRRYRRPGAGAHPGQAQGLAGHADAAAQPAVRDARRRSAVVRLVRLQRRFGDCAQAALAGSTFVTTTVATAAAMLAWLLTERIRDGKATSLGAASGIVAGLVAITPSCSSVNVVGALVIGVVAGVLCALAVGLKYKLGYDDSLDVVGVHLVGGLVGTLLIGLVAAPETRRRGRGPVLRRRIRPIVAAGSRCRCGSALFAPSLPLSWL